MASSSAFILNGVKLDDKKTIYNPKNGDLQRECAEKFHKVLWYNAYQEKMLEEYLPKEFFTDDKRIYESLNTKDNNE